MLVGRMVTVLLRIEVGLSFCLQWPTCHLPKRSTSPGKPRPWHHCFPRLSSISLAGYFCNVKVDETQHGIPCCTLRASEIPRGLSITDTDCREPMERIRSVEILREAPQATEYCPSMMTKHYLSSIPSSNLSPPSSLSLSWTLKSTAIFF